MTDEKWTIWSTPDCHLMDKEFNIYKGNKEIATCPVHRPESYKDAYLLFHVPDLKQALIELLSFVGTLNPTTNEAVENAKALIESFEKQR